MNSNRTQNTNDLYATDTNWRKDDEQFEKVLKFIMQERFNAKSFGSRLYTARMNAGISQHKLGIGIEVSGVSISKMESGKSGNGIRKKVTVKQLRYFCDVLHVTPEYLLGFTDDPYKYLHATDSTPAAVLKAWELQADDLVTREPLCTFSEDTAVKVKYVVKQLWNHHFELLFDLFQISKTPIVSYKITCEIFKASFIKRAEYPDFSIEPNCEIPFIEDMSNPHIQEVFQQLARNDQEYKNRDHIYPVFEDRELSEDAKRYTHGCYVYNAITQELMRSGGFSPDLLKEFTRVAFLPETSKKE